jgi:DNA-binding response OmpR family regulator
MDEALFQGLRIFWVEDDYYAVRRLLDRLVRNGAQVDKAISATEAYRVLSSRATDYGLIVVDLILPLTL